MATKKELLAALREAQREAAALQKELRAVNSRKEELFRRRESLKAAIRKNNELLKSTRSQRDQLTALVKATKEKRASAAARVHALLCELRESKKQKESVVRKGISPRSPERIRNLMDELEFTIETQAISFDREKELMKKINALKKDMGSAVEAREVTVKLTELSQAVAGLRREADGHHAYVQQHARQSQQLHEQLLPLSKELDKLKKEEAAAHSAFLEHKTKSAALAKALHQQLLALSSHRKELDAMLAKEKEDQRLRKEQQQKAQEDRLTEMIKSGKKLTTKDLLGLQGK